ncbi:MAG: sugar nucleotide-binding protein [Bacteroidetes bacterium]|jgi:dTDP-4-dehydrorhamnose reductase|nr:sugar nucleotide-binding protein [Bacteroidota bacterium]
MSAQNPSILVIGAGGMLGFAMTEYYRRKGYAVRAVSRAEYDIAAGPLSKFEALLDGVDVVVNAAGVIKPLIAKTPVEAVLAVNAVFPRNVARIAAARGIQSYHVTTDCVYSGRTGRYDERALFDAEDVYGMSKNAGETPDHMVLRTSIIGEERGQSRSLLEWAISQRGKSVNGFTNHRWNGVTTVHLAEVVERIILERRFAKGIFHVHSPDTVNKFELLTILNQVYDLRLTISPVEAADAIHRDLASIHPLTREVATKPIRQQVEEMRAFFGRGL